MILSFYRSDDYSGSYFITVGNHDRQKDERFERSYNIKREILHPDYDPFNYDIALLEINGTIEFNGHVLPLCLPQQNERGYDSGVVVGWGKCYI